MSEHSVQDATQNLADLIDRALAGEGVVITRDGRPVATLSPIRAAGRSIRASDLDWLAARRVPVTTIGDDAGRLVSRLRDDEW
jgi:prevent-host-death family protein